MTLTLDEVSNIRFPMAKRPGEGYRATEVDNFVDKVEMAFRQLREEQELLTQQIEALKSSEIEGGAPNPQDAALAEEVDTLRADLQQANQVAADKDAEIGRLQADLEAARSQAQASAQAVTAAGDERLTGLQNEIDRLAAENHDLRSQLDGVRGEYDQIRGELDGLRAERDQMTGELDAARAERDQARSELDGVRDELHAVRSELDSARQALAQGHPQSAVGLVSDGVQRVEVTSSAEASPAVVRLVQLATEQAESVINEAQSEASRKTDEANKRAHELTSGAQSRADQIVGESQIRAERMISEAQMSASKTTRDATAEAERLVREAQAKANHLFKETEDRRRELFTQLELERDVLAGKVTHLRSFESEYRSGLSERLQSLLEELRGGTYEPQNPPAVLNEQNQSATPRLDALLAEQKANE